MSSDHRLDQRLRTLVNVSTFLLMVLISLFIGYLLAGLVAIRFHSDPFPYAFLTGDGDPIFVLFGTLVGIFICTGSLGQVLRVIRADGDDLPSAIGILLLMIALGFGLATLRLSVWPLLDIIRQVFF